MKICRKCYRGLPQHAFDVHLGKDLAHRKRPVLQSWCRECSKEHKREYTRRRRSEQRQAAEGSSR